MTTTGNPEDVQPERPIAVDMDPTYENVGARCPKCDHLNTYSRVEDLAPLRMGRTDAIDGLDVRCLGAGCGVMLRIVGDLINPAYQMVLFDAWEFLRAKRFMQAVLAATTAYEMFFSHFLEIELLIRPSRRDKTEALDDVDWLNRMSEVLSESVGKHPFDKMRALFLKVAVEYPRPATMVEAEEYIRMLPENPRKGPREEIEAVPPGRARELLLRAYNTSIATLRNRVVHHGGYRPTLTEASEAVKDASETLNGLTQLFGIKSPDLHLMEVEGDE